MRYLSHQDCCFSIVLAIAMGLNVAALADPISPGRAGFDQAAAPFIRTYCVNCHGAEKPKGKIALHDIDPDLVAGPDVEKWRRVFDQLDLGDMPPEEAKKQPAPALRRQIAAWLGDELQRAGKGHDLDDFAHGNRVNHEALFSGEHKGPAYSPARLWRISPFISEGKYKDRSQLGRHLHSASQPYALGDEPGVRDYAARYRLDGPTLELLLLNADELVKNQIGPSPQQLEAMDKAYIERVNNNPDFDEKRKKAALRKKPSGQAMRWSNKEVHALAYGDQPPSRAQMEAIVRMQFQLALLRQPTKDELNRTLKLFAESVTEGGNLEGVRAVLTAILLSPEAIYRMELGLGERLPDGRRKLAPMEVALALSYALRDVGPDKELMADVVNGKIADKAVMAQHITRMYDTELYGNYRRIQASRIWRFFREFFGYAAAPGVFKDGSRHPGFRHQPERLVDDTDALVRYIVTKDKDVLGELLTTNTAAVYVKQKDFRLTYKAYGLTRKQAEAYVKAVGDDKEAAKTKFINGRGFFQMPEHERAGILTQPSWLAAHSQNFDNDPVLRGKWIYERLLAGVIPDVPITVDATVPADHDKTLRQRFAKTRAEYCWRCHRKMNPLGMAFEMFDDVGRYRDKEMLRDNKTFIPAVSYGEIIASGEPGLDGKVDNAIDLVNRLAGSPRVRQSFIRHAFRYWMGRNETLDDSPTLIAADKAYVESGGSFKALIVSLLTSDSFLYRK